MWPLVFWIPAFAGMTAYAAEPAFPTKPVRVLKSTDVQKNLAAVGQEPAWQETPEQFYAFMKVEAAKWAKVVKESGAHVE